jgi:DNA-binding winged helix-turn-helix (wHTH) protein/Tol biopolymer transport system component
MMAAKSFVFRFDDAEVREREFSVAKAGETSAVEPKAFRVLLILLHNPGKLITKEELLNAVWGDAAVTENSLTRSIALLRRLLGDDAHSPRFIETVATVGYRFLCPVEVVEDPAGAAKENMAASATAAAPVAGAPPRGMVRRWMLAAAAMMVALMAVGFWYLTRPLPTPRITGYTQITHDGRRKDLIGTDGSRLYFTQYSPQAIAQVGVNGGEMAQIPITVPGRFYLSDISPDGSNTLIGSFEEGRAENSTWIAPIIGGAARRLGEGESSEFSPDGSWVISTTQEGDVYVVRTDGTQKRKLANVGSADDWFGWSPDGRVIRFARNSRLWEMSSDGSGLHQLLPDWHEPGPQCCGKWAPDGHLYVFLLNNSTFNPIVRGEIWALEEGRKGLLHRGAANPIRLTTGPIEWVKAVPSKDGKTIFAQGMTERGELSRVDTKTGALQPYLGGISAEFVSFSNDGKSIVYVTFPDEILWKADRDGSNRVKLSGPPDYPYNPRWSPDSSQILFSINTMEGHSAIYLASPEGGAPQKLLSDDNAQVGDANWSPDGKRILFQWGGRYGSPEKRELRIFDLDSRQMTTVPGSTGLWSPRWSSDGRYIAALAYPQTPDLRIFDFKTQRWTALPTSGDVEWPSFSHDNRYIYFLRSARDQGVFRIPVTGGKEECVVDMRSNWHLVGYLFSSMALDPTDAPLVLRDTGSDDIYALTLEEK